MVALTHATGPGESVLAMSCRTPADWARPTQFPAFTGRGEPWCRPRRRAPRAHLPARDRTLSGLPVFVPFGSDECGIPDVLTLGPREGRERMPYRRRGARDVPHLSPACHQRIGDELTMASPPHRFRAHQREASRGFLPPKELVHRGPPRGCGEVIGVSAEALVLPGAVGRVGSRSTMPAEITKVPVGDARLVEKRLKRVLREMWMPPRLWHQPDVGHRVDLVCREQGEERRSRVRGMPDGEQHGAKRPLPRYRRPRARQPTSSVTERCCRITAVDSSRNGHAEKPIDAVPHWPPCRARGIHNCVARNTPRDDS